MSAATASPCIGVCVVEAETGWCAGCQRTLSEIAAWAALSEAGRQEVLERVARRRARMQLRDPASNRAAGA